MSAPQPQKLMRVIECKGCGGQVQIRAQGFSLSVVCSACGSVLDHTQEDAKILQRAAQALQHTRILLPLGTRGTFHGDKWEVIGYIDKTDGTRVYHWDEYLLFNPYKGFRWLVQANGHWSFVTPVKGELPKIKSAGVWAYKNYYRRFLTGEARVNRVAGEFYWQIEVGKVTQVADYILPPEMLSMEKDDDEITWSLGAYVEPSEVRRAFPQALPFPAREGVAPHQPYAADQSWPKIKAWTQIFVALIVLMQVAACFTSRRQEVLSERIRIEQGPDGKWTPLAFPPFEIRGAPQVIEIVASAPVTNSYLGLDLELVNEATQQSRSFEADIEYYWGTDSDGAWSEGGQTKKVQLAEVGSGTYRLIGAPSTSMNAGVKSYDLDLRVRTGYVPYSNFWLSLLFVLIVPGWVMLRKTAFEARRMEGAG